VLLMTAQQVGIAAFRAAPDRVHLTDHGRVLTPQRLLEARARDDSQGLLGFLRGLKTRYSVIFDEQDPTARFSLINTQHLTTAAQSDTRDHRARDPRCHEGPIPVQCRAASCGTCWVGVLGGHDKVSPMQPLERRRLREFGYIDTDDTRPVIRLACQTQATGNVTIVIPPYNGIFGRFLGWRAASARRDDMAQAR
jgi:ferredoxin